MNYLDYMLEERQPMFLLSAYNFSLRYQIACTRGYSSAGLQYQEGTHHVMYLYYNLSSHLIDLELGMLLQNIYTHIFIYTYFTDDFIDLLKLFKINLCITIQK